MYGCTGVQVPPPFIHFIPMLWAVLACVAILPTPGNYWNHLELLRFSWMCLAPSTWNVWLHWCAGPPPFHTFYSHALGCVGMRCHSPYYWKLLEPPGTPKILLGVPPPVPEMYGCTGVQVPPFYTFYSHALGCVGMRCHSPYYWKLSEPPGTYTTLGFSWMCPAPQYLKCMAALMCRSPPFHTWQTEKPQLVLGSWWLGSEDKVNLCSTLWVRLLKASDTIRLWNSMSEKKQRVERVIRNGQGWIRSTHFNHLQPKAQPKKTSFRYRTILKKCWEKAP